METRANFVLIGSFTLAVIAAAFGFVLWFQSLHTTKTRSPLRIIFEGPASGLRNGGSVNFNGIRVGEVISVKLDNPRRVVALAMVANDAPIRKDTLVGLEFQGLTGVAAISLTGGSIEAPPVPLDEDGVPVLTADPNALLDTQEKIRVALRNVDKVIADNQDALKDTLLGFETFTASLASSSARIDSVVNSAVTGVGAVDSALTKTQGFLAGLASDKSGGELLPTVMSMRELIESLDKRSGALMSDGRKMLGDISASVNKADRKIGGR
jgi:phospholipid/cholesterol/gamma-HCH transport system substrate-binding protein